MVTPAIFASICYPYAFLSVVQYIVENFVPNGRINGILSFVPPLPRALAGSSTPLSLHQI